MKIGLIVNDDFSLWHFRKGLIIELISKGHEVIALLPDGLYVEKIASLGVRCILIKIDRFISPLKDLSLTHSLYRICKEEKFDLVHTMTIKPNIYGTLAAKFAKCHRIVGLVSGSGFVFTKATSFKSKMVLSAAKLLYRFALHFSDKVWFQNPDDFELFVRKKLINKDKGVVILSGGINTSEYSQSTVMPESLTQVRTELLLPPNAKCVVMIVARMIWSKGIKEFIESAHKLKRDYPDWMFVLLSPKDAGSPDHVDENYINSMRSNNLVIIDTFRSDVKTFVALADIITLPSFYNEGVPRSLLEALAMGKPVVTTDHPGCKETVIEGINGFLIPICDSEALSTKLSLLMSDQELRARFGQASQKLAMEQFDEKIVINNIFSKLYSI